MSMGKKKSGGDSQKLEVRRGGIGTPNGAHTGTRGIVQEPASLQDSRSGWQRIIVYLCRADGLRKLMKGTRVALTHHVGYTTRGFDPEPVR